VYNARVKKASEFAGSALPAHFELQGGERPEWYPIVENQTGRIPRLQPTVAWRRASAPLAENQPEDQHSQPSRSQVGRTAHAVECGRSRGRPRIKPLTTEADPPAILEAKSLLISIIRGCPATSEDLP
jgi:hypothetical protein